MGHVVSTKGMIQNVDQRLVRSASCNARLDVEQCPEETTGDECPICTEVVAIKDLARLNPCNHEFHQECINLWLDDHSSCPNCRQEVCQVLFNFRGRARDEPRDIQPLSDEESEDDDDDEDDDDPPLMDEGTNDREDYGEDSLPPTQQLVVGEAVQNDEWLLLDDLMDAGDGMPLQVKIRIGRDEWIFFTFYSKSPEICLQTTGVDISWDLMFENEVVIHVPPNSQLTIRGFFFLHLEDLVIRVGDNLYPLRDDPEFDEFLHPNPNGLAFFEAPEMEMARAERIQMFMEYLRNHIENN